MTMLFFKVTTGFHASQTQEVQGWLLQVSSVIKQNEMMTLILLLKEVYDLIAKLMGMLYLSELSKHPAVLSLISVIIN